MREEGKRGRGGEEGGRRKEEGERRRCPFLLPPSSFLL
jgi:hypothetical protein